MLTPSDLILRSPPHPTITPSSFGEKTFKAEGAPAPFEELNDYTYVGTAKCPGSSPNLPCTIKFVDGAGNTLASKTITPARQVGPLPKTASARMCKWYDGDTYHPMVSIGMDSCSSDEGPSDCADDNYVDDAGCPNSNILARKLENIGWDFSGSSGQSQMRSALNARKRFNKEDGKCVDYQECTCTGCEADLRTDVGSTKYFTGFGFYTPTGGWVPFSKPLGQMSTYDKRETCVAAFKEQGRPFANSRRLGEEEEAEMNVEASTIPVPMVDLAGASAPPRRKLLQSAASTQRMLITQYSDTSCTTRDAAVATSTAPISAVGNTCYSSTPSGKSYKWTLSGTTVKRLDYSDLSCATLHATHTLASLNTCSATTPFGGVAYKITTPTVDSSTTKLTLGLFSTHSCTGGLASTPGATTTGTVTASTCRPKVCFYLPLHFKQILLTILTCPPHILTF